MSFNNSSSNDLQPRAPPKAETQFFGTRTGLGQRSCRSRASLSRNPTSPLAGACQERASFRHFPLTSYRRRAWDHAHQDQLKDAVTSGTTPDRGIYRHIADAKIREAQFCLKKGKLRIREISSRTGLSQSTVRREKCRMTDQ